MAVDPHDRVMEVAIEIFSRRGFAGTSLRDLAAATQMSVSNIYHHFGSKHGVFTAAMLRSTEELVRTLRTATRGAGDPIGRFRRLLRAHLRLIVERPAQARIYAQDVDHLSAELTGITHRAQREVLSIYLEVLEGLQDAGCLEGRELAPVAFNIFGVLNWSLRWYREGGTLSAEEAIAQIATFVEHGLLGPSGSIPRVAGEVL